MRTLNTLLLLWLVCVPARGAEPLPDEAAVRAHVERLLDVFKDRDVARMVERLREHTPDVPGYADGVKTFLEQAVLPKLAAYGKPTGASLIVRQVGLNGRFAKWIYVLHFEQAYLVCSFRAYLGSTGWFLKGFAIDAPEDEMLLYREDGVSPTPAGEAQPRTDATTPP